MANHNSTKKAIRKTATKTLVNKSYRNMVRTVIKKFIKDLGSETKENLKVAFSKVQSLIMKACSKGIFKKNTASRMVKSLSVQLKKK